MVEKMKTNPKLLISAMVLVTINMALTLYNINQKKSDN